VTGLQPSRKCITRLAKLDEAAFVKRLAGVTRRLAAAECKTLRVTLEHLALQSAAKVRAGGNGDRELLAMAWKASSIQPAEQPIQHQTEYQTSHHRKVEGKPRPFDDDVTWQTTSEWSPPAQDRSHRQQGSANDHQLRPERGVHNVKILIQRSLLVQCRVVTPG
jgi:hypothetical protein